MHVTKHLLATVALSTAITTPVAVVVAPPASASPTWCVPTGVLSIDDLPSVIDPAVCALTGRLLASGDIQVEVPPPGTTNAAYALATTAGAVQSLVVQATPDGVVIVNPQTSTTSADLQPVTDSDVYIAPLGTSDDNLNGAEADIPDPYAVDTTVAGSPSKCSDTARAYYAGYPRWRSAPSYYYNPANQKAGYTTTQYVSTIRAAQVNMTRGDNTCGFTADPNIYGTYVSTTTTGTQVVSTTTGVSCSTQDSRSVVGWGSLSGGYLAYACMSWDAYSYMKAADIKIATNHSWSVGSLSGCSNKWDLQGTMTHEFGHFFGLNHVSESTHGNLVMSSSINGRCQANERNLGRGDLLGMLALYGRTA